MFVRLPSPTTETGPPINAELQDASTPFDDSENQLKKPKSIDTNYLFSFVLSPVYVFAQQNKPLTSFERLATLITQLIKNRLMSIAFLNEQSLKLMHIDWNQV